MAETTEKMEAKNTKETEDSKKPEAKESQPKPPLANPTGTTNTDSPAGDQSTSSENHGEESGSDDDGSIPDEDDSKHDLDDDPKKGDEKWEEMFSRLLKYREDYGNCLVPNRYKDDPQLGSWVAAQRRQYKDRVLYPEDFAPALPKAAERIKRLQEIGFKWRTKDPRHVPWELRYNQLKDFVEKYGHAQVPIGWSENVKLANWVSTQRQEFKLMQKGRPTRLSRTRINLLNELQFVWEAQRGGPRRVKKARMEVPETANPVNMEAARKRRKAQYEEISRVSTRGQPGGNGFVRNADERQFASPPAVGSLPSGFSGNIGNRPVPQAGSLFMPQQQGGQPQSPQGNPVFVQGGQFPGLQAQVSAQGFGGLPAGIPLNISLAPAPQQAYQIVIPGNGLPLSPQGQPYFQQQQQQPQPTVTLTLGQLQQLGLIAPQQQQQLQLSGLGGQIQAGGYGPVGAPFGQIQASNLTQGQLQALLNQSGQQGFQIIGSPQVTGAPGGGNLAHLTQQLSAQNSNMQKELLDRMFKPQYN